MEESEPTKNPPFSHKSLHTSRQKELLCNQDLHCYHKADIDEHFSKQLCIVASLIIKERSFSTVYSDFGVFDIR